MGIVAHLSVHPTSRTTVLFLFLCLLSSSALPLKSANYYCWAPRHYEPSAARGLELRIKNTFIEFCVPKESEHLAAALAMGQWKTCPPECWTRMDEVGLWQPLKKFQACAVKALFHVSGSGRSSMQIILVTLVLVRTRRALTTDTVFFFFVGGGVGVCVCVRKIKAMLDENNVRGSPFPLPNSPPCPQSLTIFVQRLILLLEQDLSCRSGCSGADTNRSKRRFADGPETWS